jgi:hypothetical protein
MADPSFFQIVGGGLVGSGVTYCLTLWRERRKVLDAYRAPQREVISGLIAATHDFVIAEGLLSYELERDAESEYDVPNPELDPAAAAFHRARYDLDKAFQGCRLAIVDADCYRAMGIANNNYIPMRRLFQRALEGNRHEMKAICAELDEFAARLLREVNALVPIAQEHLAPTQNLWNRLRRRQVSKELHEKYFKSEEIETRV